MAGKFNGGLASNDDDVGTRCVPNNFVQGLIKRPHTVHQSCIFPCSPHINLPFLFGEKPCLIGDFVGARYTDVLPEG
jgi:hypothetical protein